MGLALDILETEVRKQIAASDDVLSEARARRDLAAESGMELDGALRWFRSGSVAHAMVNKPVSDADSGIVLDRRSYPSLGPDGDGEGPDDVVDALQELVGPKVREKYPNAVVEKSRRGLLVEFKEPTPSGEDPTVDLIITLTRKDADGLWIPDLDAEAEEDRWTPSHPEKHTELFTGGARERRALRARVARMAKAWNKQWAERDRALSSFNISALAWEYIDDGSVALDETLAGWFGYSSDELDKAETEDPASVSEPIRVLLSRTEAVKRLRQAADDLDYARAAEPDEDKVREALARVYPDFIDSPGKAALAAALRTSSGAGATKTGVTLGAGAAMKPMRTYGGSPTDG